MRACGAVMPCVAALAVQIGTRWSRIRAALSYQRGRNCRSYRNPNPIGSLRMNPAHACDVCMRDDG